MYRITALALILGSMALASCVDPSTTLVDTHCAGRQDGDGYCAEQHADRPYCVLGTNTCHDTPGLSPMADGCAAIRPADNCYSPCGMNQSLLDNSTCEGSTTTATTTGPTGPTTLTSTNPTLTGPTTIDPDSSTTEVVTTLSTTTLGEDCASLGCPDPATPICADTGECVGCDGASEPNQACAALDEDTPVCVDGACVQCSPNNVGACDAELPVCNTNNVCEGCTEHSHCPDSACHLDSDDAGTCFDEDEVVDVADTDALYAALAGLTAEDDVVVRLTGSSYALESLLEVNSGEVAIIGVGVTTITRSGTPIISVSSDGYVYFSNIQLSGNQGEGLVCVGEAVWLDDSDVVGNSEVGINVRSGCAAHLRRTAVFNNAGGGIEASNGADLFIENSAIGLNGSLASQFGGLDLNTVDVQITYSTIVGNQAGTNNRASVFCDSSMGFVRNSIVIGPSGNTVQGCNNLDWGNNARDSNGPGNSSTDVGNYDNDWFVNPAARNVRLTATGAEQMEDIARWEEGDPFLDIDGTPITQNDDSFPGYHQYEP